MQEITLAIVEDLEEVREGLRQYLCFCKEFRVLQTFTNAEEASTRLPLIRPDIVIMDINLPGMNGIECIKNVRKTCSSIQFLMFTVYENDDKVFEALKAGATGYLLKKSGFSIISDAIKELYNGGSPINANIARKLVSLFQHKNEVPEISALSEREIEILHLLSQGLLYKEISEKLFITVGTVSQHVHKIYEKLHVQNRTEAINILLGRKP